MPGALVFTKPAGPAALKRSIHSRTCLQTDPGLLGCPAARSVVDRRRQQPGSRIGVIQSLRQRLQTLAAGISVEYDRGGRGKPPAVCHLN
jgi:hypothetical protein